MTTADRTPNPFTRPPATHPAGTARPRDPVVVEGVVTRNETARWAGGDVREITVADPTGQIVLVFFGRRDIGGTAVGRTLTAAGTVVAHQGRNVLLNPQLWLPPRPSPRPLAVDLYPARDAGRSRHRRQSRLQNPAQAGDGETHGRLIDRGRPVDLVE